MAMSMPSEELQLLIAGYVLGDLDPEEAAEFEQLLAHNPAIADEISQMQVALETAYTSPEVVPPAHLRSTILAKVASTVTSPVVAKRRKLLTWRTAFEVAAAILILALGINNYTLRQTLQTAQVKSPQSETLIYVLNATDAASQASAKVVVNPDNLEAAISVQNLPPLPPGKVYALWTVVSPKAPYTTDDKKAILTEVFEVDERGNFSQTIVVPKVFRSEDLVTKIAVTIENANAPQKHIGSPIMITKL